MAFGYAKRIRGTKGPVEFECGDEGSMSTGRDLCDLHRTGPRYTQFYDLGHGYTGQIISRSGCTAQVIRVLLVLQFGS
jgi:hypothetical protein